MTNQKPRLIRICLLLMTLLTLFVPCASFADTNTSSADYSDDYKILRDSVNQDIIPNSNRYYYKTEVVSTNNYTFTVTKAQAATEAKYESRLRTVMRYTLGLSAAAVDFFAPNFIDKYYSTPTAAAGTYNATVQKLRKYRVDSLTGEKHLDRTGRKVTFTKGSTASYTLWDK